MRTFTPSSLLTFLNTGAPFLRSQLVTIVLQSGLVLRYCEWDVDITIAPNTFLARGPIVKRSGVTHKAGTEVDEVTLTITPKATDLVSGQTWGDTLRSGALDYADINIDFAIFDVAGTYKGFFNWFNGKVSDIPQVGGITAQIKVRSELGRLNILMPRNLTQPGCLNTLFDRQCSLNPASYVNNSSTILSVNSDGSLATTYPGATGQLDQGRLVVTSGPNSNVVRKIKANLGANIYLFAPLYYTPSSGTTLSLLPGCAKTRVVCNGTYNNLPNYRGMDFVPLPETVV